VSGRVVVVGSVNMDVVVRVPHLPSPGQTLAGHGWTLVPGGKGANQAVAAARLGADTAFVGCVGDDDFGARLRAALAQDGVDLSRLRVADGVATGVAVVMVDDRGENAIAVVAGANARVTAADAAPAVSGAAICLLQCEIPPAAVVGSAALARAAGARVWLDPAPPVSLPDEIWPLCDLVLPNAQEAEALTGIRVGDEAGAVAAGRALLQRGAGAAIVKRGAAGAVLVTPTEVVAVPAHAVATVDTTAAGDCFAGALAAASARGDDLVAAMRFASAAAALSTTRTGAQSSLPHRSEVERFLLGVKE
jgi:ribokinase